ncbi:MULTISPECIES: ABC transporter ATP-binding protein [Bradyrhizobium]|jgi:ABC-type Fe3+/spermidine/putrescine transport system ATPase subunit|uniref:ABC transporter ATP-binding protein n=1 Tax=Bradyrhizobium TaxID=374 RepID=UPI0003F6AAF8|nr:MULTISPECIES: ABC transporter ATP-binding protein [Bradyrhizobium]KQT20435.1 hypothetical protein ASG57_28370 [Bradyrhizobium sp. Leaf396]
MQVDLLDVHKSFGGTKVLKGITASFHSGRITALVGPSGSGKSTLLNIIAGLAEPTSGKVHFSGMDVTRVPTEKRQVGLVFQNHALFPHLNVFGNVEFGLRVRSVPPKERHERVMEALEMVELDHLADRSISTLSGGQRQRVALARALVIEPNVLLLDEPLSALDVELRRRIREELRALLAPLKVPTVLVTHDRDDAFILADEIVLLLDGQIAQSGPPEDMYHRPTSAMVARFFGEANFLVPESASIEDMELFRPEDVTVVSSAAEADLVVTVTSARFLGNRRRITGRDSRGAEVMFDVGKTHAVREGETVHIRINGHVQGVRGALRHAS